MVEFLLRSGADVNAANKDDMTALVRAAAGAPIDVVRCLLAAGAVVTTGAFSREPPLVTSPEIALLLIRALPDISFGIDIASMPPLFKCKQRSQCFPGPSIHSDI